MASNTSVEAGVDSEQTTGDSSPVVSVDSCDDKHEVKSDSDTRRTTTPVIREPSQSSEKSTPVSPMDNAFFPGPEKWWYQKEWEQKGTKSKRGVYLDLEPDNWWGCRRHSETDIIGIPPPSPDRRHSLTPELSCSKPVAQGSKQQEKNREKKDVQDSSKIADGDCDKSAEISSSPEADDANFQTETVSSNANDRSLKRLDPPKSDVIDLSDVDEEQEPIPGKEGDGIDSEQSQVANNPVLDDQKDLQQDVLEDTNTDWKKADVEESSAPPDEHQTGEQVNDPVFDDQKDYQEHVLIDAKIDCKKAHVEESSAPPDEQQAGERSDLNASHMSSDNDNDNLQDSGGQLETELSQNETDPEELQSPESPELSVHSNGGFICNEQLFGRSQETLEPDKVEEESEDRQDQNDNLQDTGSQLEAEQSQNETDPEEFQSPDAESIETSVHSNGGIKSDQQLSEQSEEFLKPNEVEEGSDDRQDQPEEELPSEPPVVLERQEELQSTSEQAGTFATVVIADQNIERDYNDKQTSSDVPESEIEMLDKQENLNVDENLTKVDKNSEIVESQKPAHARDIESKDGKTEDEIESHNSGVSHLSESSPGEQSSSLKNTSADALSPSLNGQSLKPEEDQNVEEKEEPSPDGSQMKTRSHSKQSKTLLEERSAFISRDTPHSGDMPEPSKLSQRRGKSQLEEDPIVFEEEDQSKERGIHLADDYKWNSFKIFIGVCFVLLLLVYLALSSLLTLFIEDNPVESHPSKPFREVIFYQHLKHLEEDFPSQSPMLWNVIGGAVFSHIQDPPLLERPVVLLLAGLPNSESTTNCLATKLGTMFYDIFQSSQQPVVVNGSLYKEESADYAKMKIDESLKSGFQSSSHCAIIHNLDSIPPCAILLFHSYCENDNAPYKDVAIVHTIQLTQTAEALGELDRPKDYERVVSNHLRSVWEACPDLTEDKQSAMLSRVANNVAVIVKGESEDQLSKVCS